MRNRPARSPGSLSILLAACSLVAAGAWNAVLVQTARADWELLAGLPIVEVEISSSEIFDAQEVENNLFYGWANALHIRTRNSVIERELLFSEGEPFDPLLVQESARNLRRIGIFQEVEIRATRQEAGVRVEVVTEDRWSTRVIADISSQGSIVQLRLGLEDINFAGRAFRLGGTVVASNDVDAVDFRVSDPRLLGTRWQGAFLYSADNLAIINEARLGRPHYSERARWTSNLDYRSVRGERRLFGPESVTLDTLNVNETFGEAFVAVHGQARPGSRLGLLLSRRRITRDVQQEQGSLALVWSFMQRSFRSMRNVDRYGVIEDIGSGWTLQLGAGADIEALGADHNRPMWRADAAWAMFPNLSTHLGAALRHHGFARDGRVESSRLAAETWGFWKQSELALLGWNAGFFALVREPEFLQFTLGGDTRLRGYEARHGVGTRTLFLSVEERVFSDLNVLFLRLGAAFFVDVGQAWGPGEQPRWEAMNVGAGFGLRIGNRKSGAGVSRLDFAFGHDNFEISLSGGSFFRAGRSMEYLLPSLFR